MTDHVVSKIDVARRQLECAIRLYFNSADAISVHTLGSAARNVLLDLCLHRGITAEVFLADMLAKHVKPEHHKRINDSFRRAENFFKHADRDPEGTHSFNPESSGFTLFEATEAYARLTGESTAAMLTYRTWWLSHQPYLQAILPPEVQQAFQSLPYQSEQKLQFYLDVLPAWVGLVH